MKPNNNNHNHNNRRSRGRRNPTPNRAQSFDSNGPDVRIRGTAQQVHEKYCALAKDAAGIGDKIMAENYLQHAEHYLRLMNEQQSHRDRNEARHQASQNRNDIFNEAQADDELNVTVEAVTTTNQQHNVQSQNA